MGKVLTAIGCHYSASVDGALGRRRFLCCLGGRSSLLCAGWYWWLEKQGRRASQLGTSIGSASRNSNRAGSDAGFRRVNGLWSFRKVTECGYLHQYVASRRLARSSSGLSNARQCSVASERSRSILMETLLNSSSPASQAFGMICSLCV